jgi:hypothetical protein
MGLNSGGGADMHFDESPILIDAPDGQGEFDKDMLERMGHRVMVCTGPSNDALCPILEEGGNCEMVDAAHGLVFEFDLDREQHRDILRKYQEIVQPGVPIRAVVLEGQQHAYPELLAGIEVWTHSPNVAELDGFSARVEAYERGLDD